MEPKNFNPNLRSHKVEKKANQLRVGWMVEKIRVLNHHILLLKIKKYQQKF